MELVVNGSRYRVIAIDLDERTDYIRIGNVVFVPRVLPEAERVSRARQAIALTGLGDDGIV